MSFEVDRAEALQPETRIPIEKMYIGAGITLAAAATVFAALIYVIVHNL